MSIDNFSSLLVQFMLLAVTQFLPNFHNFQRLSRLSRFPVIKVFDYAREIGNLEKGREQRRDKTWLSLLHCSGAFSLTKTATGILFKFSNIDDFQAVYKKGFHKVTGARFYKKVLISPYTKDPPLQNASKYDVSFIHERRSPYPADRRRHSPSTFWTYLKNYPKKILGTLSTSTGP